MPSPTALTFARDSTQQNSFVPSISNTMVSAAMTNGVPGTTTVPITSDKWIVSFRYTPGSEFWVNVSGVAAVIPTSSTASSTTSEMNPASLVLIGGTVINWISPNAISNISIVMWQTI